METDKLLYHFQKESDFLANQINLPETGIAFVKDAQTVYTHGKEYNFLNWGELSEYEAVDLGLPSGLLWANKNIGAETEEDAGLYFQWGDTQGYTAAQVGTDKQFDSGWTDYKWSNSSNFTKYTGSDGLTILEPADDAATQLMGLEWRMPTDEEIKELVDNTDIYFISTDSSEVQATPNGSDYFTFPEADSMKGIKFYRRGDHSKYIFVPAFGYAFDDSVQDVGVNGLLWLSSLYTSNAYGAWFLYFDASEGGGVDYGDRCRGFGVRAVKPQQ